MENKMKTIASVISIATFVGVIWGAQSFLYTTFALAKDLQQVTQRIDIIVLEDELTNKQKRLWTLEDRYEDKYLPPDRKQEMRELDSDIDKLKKELDVLYQQKGKE